MFRTVLISKDLVALFKIIKVKDTGTCDFVVGLY